MLATSFRPYYIVLVLYFAHVLNSYALAGSLLAILPISQAFFEVPTGVISDKIGRVFSIKLSVALEIVALLLYTLFPTYWILAIGSVILGSTFALTSGNNDALIYDSAASIKPSIDTWRWCRWCEVEYATSLLQSVCANFLCRCICIVQLPMEYHRILY